MVTFNGVNHLALVTGDMNATIRFWRDLLGMRLVAGLGAPGYRHYFFELSGTDLVAFFEWPGVEPLPEKAHGSPVRGPVCWDHVSFGVESEDDLWELKDRISAAGFYVSDVIDHGFIHSIYAYDPNGVLTPGMFARLKLGTGEAKPAVLIDDRAVGTDQSKKFVFVVGAENKVAYREVKLGPTVEGLRVVRDGLNAGERIVVNGVQRVRPGAVVAPSEVPMNDRSGLAQRPAGAPSAQSAASAKKPS